MSDEKRVVVINDVAVYATEMAMNFQYHLGTIAFVDRSGGQREYRVGLTMGGHKLILVPHPEDRDIDPRSGFYSVGVNDVLIAAVRAIEQMRGKADGSIIEIRQE